MNQEEFINRTNVYNVIREVAERWHMNYDMLRFCLGDKISHGEFREVFEWNLRKDVVCKIAYNSRSNIVEYETWQAVKDVPYSKWFAPIIDISPCGHFLLMKKARPISEKDKLPKTIPDMLCDIKKENFGFIGKQFVCIDYQFMNRAYDLASHVQPKKLEFDKWIFSKK